MVEASDMIHKSLVVILTALTLACAYLFVIGFWDEYGVIYDVVDGIFKKLSKCDL